MLQVLANAEAPMCTLEILDALSAAHDIYPDIRKIHQVCRQLVEEGVATETRLRQDKPGSRALVLAWEAV